MKRFLLLGITLFVATLTFAQSDNSCYKIWEKHFNKRGAYSVADDMHRNIIVSFIEGDEAYCYKGKVRVEGGKITSIFIQYEDHTYELFDKKFYNQKREKPGIVNGMSDIISTDDGEKLRVFFIEKVKPKKKQYQAAPLPTDL